MTLVVPQLGKDVLMLTYQKAVFMTFDQSQARKVSLFISFFQPAASNPVYEDESNHGVHSTISHEVYSPIFTTAIPTIDCCLMLLKH